jgi:hypothetical protein
VVSDEARLFLILLLLALAAIASLTTLIIVAVQSTKNGSWCWPNRLRPPGATVTICPESKRALQSRGAGREAGEVVAVSAATFGA